MVTNRELLKQLQELDECDLDNTIDTAMPHSKSNYVEYSHNNSGGRDWVTDEGWQALSDTGWKLKRFDDGRPYGAVRHGLSLSDAVSEWERLTGACSTDMGCPCCGPPHSFTEYDSCDQFVDSGPKSYSSRSW